MSGWNVTSPAQGRYHGLVNQGATCYLNSVLQALFMTEGFKEAVRTCENQEENIDPKLRVLFDGLENGTTSTGELIRELDIDRVYEQRDAAEYFVKILQRTSPKASQIFHGQLDNRTTCSTCHFKTNNDAPFWYLPLSIAKKDYSVEDGIKTFFKPLELSGASQMYCEQCDTKVDATFENVMKRHPDVLVLLLKRFNFSYQYMSYIKNNQPVDVPSSLHIPEDSTYELYAVVDHVGDLRGGHYATKIKIQDGNEQRWYNFNDDNVTLVDGPIFQENTEKSRSAYLLFYRRQTKTETPDVANETSSQPNEDDDHEARGRRSASDQLHRQDRRSDTCKRRRDANTDEDEPAQARRRKSVTGLDKRSPEHPEQSDEDSGRVVNEGAGKDVKPVNREEDEESRKDPETETQIQNFILVKVIDETYKPNSEILIHSVIFEQYYLPRANPEMTKSIKTEDDTDGKVSADEVTSGDVAAKDQGGKQEASFNPLKEQTKENEECADRKDSDFCVTSIQQEEKNCWSDAPHGDDAVGKQPMTEGDRKEAELKEKHSESGGSPAETQKETPKNN